jgi:3-dehydroquinate synthetase
MDGLGMACSPPPVELGALVRAAGFDKKVHRGRLTTAIIEDIGRVRLERIDLAEIPQLFSSFSGSK